MSVLNIVPWNLDCLKEQPANFSIFGTERKLAGAIINLYEQPGTMRRGPGDIANLWIGGGFIGSFHGANIRNAIKANSSSKWIRYQNDRHQYIIPYIITGKFGKFF
uniref:Uncharacterized protein n=1 Tax=Meloidogyne hapla TaxID=6305 RepID=A0A1I8B711_MELHA